MGWLDGRRPVAPFSPGTPSESSGLSPGPRGREGATLGFSGSEPHVKKGGKRYCHGHSKLIAIVVAQKTRNRQGLPVSASARPGRHHCRKVPESSLEARSGTGAVLVTNQFAAV